VATTADLLTDAFGRVREEVHQVLEGLSADQLAYRPDADANSIGWLVWHLTRVQDDHVAAAGGMEQRWTANTWAGRFDLPFDTHDTGYGHDRAEVARFRAGSDLLAAYHDDVHAATLDYVSHLADEDLDRIVDTRWDPPVTLGVRVVSVLADDLQHAGQAAYVRGLVERR
jgi:uncharacterized damage-inducible protein DinB